MKRRPPVAPESRTSKAVSYDAWLKAKGEASLADTRPPVPHAEAIESIRRIIAARRVPRGGWAEAARDIAASGEEPAWPDLATADDADLEWER